MAKDYFHITFIGDGSILPEIVKMSVGKIVKGSLQIVPVQHGGETETGDLKSRPTGREFLMMYLEKNPRFKVQYAIADGKALGLSYGAVYSMIGVLQREKVLKRVGESEYAATAHVMKAAGKAAGKTPAKSTRGTEGTRKIDYILTALRRLQNGSGEGVALPKIAEAVAADGIEVGGLSGAMSVLLKRKMVKRTGPGHYRATGE